MVQRGQGMAADIAEQPGVFARLLDGENSAAIAGIAAEVARRRPRSVMFVARGTSDHAALYGAYLTEIRLGLPVASASPSAITLYGARPDFRDTLVVGVSQSGGSPDLTGVLSAARETGGLTLAVTNNPDSPLARAAELSIDVAAGHERAVAATKTYTAELLALLVLIEGIRAGDGRLPDDERAALDKLPQLAEDALADPAADALAQRYRFASRMVTTGRGYAYPTAREAALKLMETSYVSAQAFSAADLMHGPLAMIDPSVPVIAVVSGRGGATMSDVLERLNGVQADVLRVGDAGGLPLVTDGVPEHLLPVLEILPLQRLAWRLALDRGVDPDRPRGLAKVTSTW